MLFQNLTLIREQRSFAQKIQIPPTAVGDPSDFLYKESPVRGLKSHQRELVDGSDPLYTVVSFRVERI